MEGKRAVFDRRQVQFSGTTVMSAQNQHPKPLYPLSHQYKDVEVRRENGPSEVGVHLGNPIDSRAKTSWKVFAPNDLVTIGILPNVSFIRQNRVLFIRPKKKPKKGDHKNAADTMKDVRQLGCVFQDTEPPEALSILRRAQKSWDQFDEYDSQKASQRHAKNPRKHRTVDR